MRVTTDYIERKFKEFNSLMFGGKLKLPVIRLSKARSFLGQVKRIPKTRFFGLYICFEYQLVISNRVVFSEQQLEDTIIHEMIHYYILSKDIADTSPHGKVFQKMMKEINEKYGRHVSVCYRPSDEDWDADRTIRAHFLCVVNFHDGRVGVCPPAKTRVLKLWDEILDHPKVKDTRWYVTYNPYFNRYRRVLSAKIYIVPKEELDANIVGAIPLLRDGNVLRRQRIKNVSSANTK